ncbi:MAG: SDR family oxidoreductase [Gemmatimonadales bacterium]
MTSPTALVTGATEGIGRATAKALGRAGYRVGVTARNAAKLEALVAELRQAGVAAAGRPADVADPTEVEGLVRHVVDALGPIEALVNNAGVAFTKPILDTTLEEWDRTFATNVRGLFLVTRAVLPGMQSLGRGDIVNIASLAGKNGVANAVAYSASKHAVMGFSRSLMLEVRRDGIRVITICPGSVDTPLLRNAPAFAPKFDRILQPEDVADTVVDALKLPRRAMVSELEIRPSNP